VASAVFFFGIPITQPTALDVDTPMKVMFTALPKQPCSLSYWLLEWWTSVSCIDPFFPRKLLTTMMAGTLSCFFS